jgi:hypothetical protein
MRARLFSALALGDCPIYGNRKSLRMPEKSALSDQLSFVAAFFFVPQLKCHYDWVPSPAGAPDGRSEEELEHFFGGS